MASVVSPALRARVRASAEPIARGFGRLGLTPNMLTLIGFAIAVLGAGLAAGEMWLAAGFAVGLGATFDMFDGALARATNRTSRLGAFLDSTFDRLGEAAVYIGIAVGLNHPDIEGMVIGGQIWAITAMTASFMVSYVRAKSESLGFTPGAGMANVGLAPREVRLVIVVVGLLGTGIGGTGYGAMRSVGSGWLLGALALITVLASITTLQRIYHVYQHAKKEP